MILRAKPFRDRGLADAGIADQQRIVLLAPAENLDRALHLGLAADQRIDPAVPGLLVQVDAIGVESAFLFLALGGLLRLLRLARFGIFVGAARRARGVGQAGALGDAVADVVDRVVARHVLLLQEIGGVGFPLGENRHEHVGAGHFLASGRLHMDGGALHDALEAGCRLGFVGRFDNDVFEFGVDIVDDVLAQQVEIDVARPEHRGRVRIVDQREQQMFQRRIFVPPLVGERERLAKGLFQRAGEYGHHEPFTFTFFP